METYSLEEYLKLQKDIENTKDTRHKVFEGIKEMKIKNETLKSKYRNIRKCISDIEVMLNKQRTLKFYQLSEQNKLKEKIETNYIRINNTEDDLKNSFKIYSRHEIESKIKEIEGILSSLNSLLIQHNNDILSKENKLKIMENNINKDNLEEQLISLENKYKNQGIKSKIEIIKLKSKFE